MIGHKSFPVPLRNGSRLELGAKPVLMGILNVTPDSFSDGGEHLGPAEATEQANRMLGEGAVIVDVGGESTRPGAREVSAEEELRRVLPVIQALRGAGVQAPISIDTYKAEVADQALRAGAGIVNDVSGLQRDPEIADIAAGHRAPVVIMHWDQERDRTRDLVSEIKRFFETSLEIAQRAGIASEQVILDPGFGFAKTLAENYELLRRLAELHVLGYPLLVGTSRKSMLGKLLDAEPRDRLAGTLATSVLGYAQGAHIFRVHDVAPNRDALRIAEATCYGPPVTGT